MFNKLVNDVTPKKTLLISFFITLIAGIRDQIVKYTGKTPIGHHACAKNNCAI